jgi:hypothetical protein
MTINYFINDPTTPDLVKQVNPPTNFPCDLRYAVKDYRGDGADLSTPEGRAAQTYYAIWNALNWLQTYKSVPSVKWAAVSVLKALPEAGQDLNAFYNRASLQYFYIRDPATNKVVYLCNSGDVVSHEVGHAILDMFQPGLWNMAALEGMAFHEAFGDFTAMMSILQFPEIIDRFIMQTGDNPRSPNVVAWLAEEAGKTLYDITGGRGGYSPHCLRSGINDFKYKNPKCLPAEAPDNQLAAECHSFGRIYVGAFYDMLIGMYKQNKSTMGPKDALTLARDILSKYVLKAIARMPLNAKLYESFAKTLLWVDAQEVNKPYTTVIKNVLTERGIISSEIKALASPVCTNNDNIVITGSQRTIKLCDHFLGVQASNPLFTAEIETYQQTAHFYDRNKAYLHTILVDDQETIEATKNAVLFLQTTQKVGTDKEFAIINGKLVRQRIQCKNC